MKRGEYVTLMHPGDSSVNWSLFNETEDKKIVLIREGNFVEQVGYTTEQIVLFQEKDKIFLKRTQLLRSDFLGNIEAITTLSRSTFLPIYHESFANGKSLKADYRDNSVTVISSSTIEKALEQPVFENHSIEMVIRLLPLQLGYATTIAAFQPNKRKIINVRVHVLAKEAVKQSGMVMVEAWKLEVDFEGQIQYYWIGLKKKELLKQVTDISATKQMIFERE